MKSELVLAFLVCAMLFTGCAGSSVSLRSTNSPALGASAPTAGSSYASAAIQAEVSPNAYFGVFILGYLMAGIHDHYLGPGSGTFWRKTPEPAADRAIAERDCTQSLGLLSANLRCK